VSEKIKEVHLLLKIFVRILGGDILE